MLLKTLGPKDSPRNEQIEYVKWNSLSKWKKKNEYHQRSLVENTFYRFKTIFTGSLSSRKFKNQETEVSLKCLILNKFITLGQPKYK